GRRSVMEARAGLVAAKRRNKPSQPARSGQCRPARVAPCIHGCGPVFLAGAPIGYRARPSKTNMVTLLLALLQDAAQAASSPSQAPIPAPSPTESLIRNLVPILVIGVLFVFMLILPERKKQKQRQQMLEALKKGDRVMTSSGIYGTVVTTSNEVVVLQ